MGTSSTALIWYLLCLGVFLFVAIVAGVLIVIGRRSEARARARLRARIGAAPAPPSDPESDSDEPPA
jgi:hypothetical protein